MLVNLLAAVATTRPESWAFGISTLDCELSWSTAIDGESDRAGDVSAMIAIARTLREFGCVHPCPTHLADRPMRTRFDSVRTNRLPAANAGVV
jgi:hypothetical protein